MGVLEWVAGGYLLVGVGVAATFYHAANGGFDHHYQEGGRLSDTDRENAQFLETLRVGRSHPLTRWRIAVVVAVTCLLAITMWPLIIPFLIKSAVDVFRENRADGDEEP